MGLAALAQEDARPAGPLPSGSVGPERIEGIVGQLPSRIELVGGECVGDVDGYAVIRQISQPMVA